MGLFGFDDKVLAAAIAATGTVIGALIQLRIAWRKEVSARARGVPVTRKSRSGPILAVGLLLVASAVGGFAASQYWVGRMDREPSLARSELQAQLQRISVMAERLEKATERERDSNVRALGGPVGTEGVTVSATVGSCRAAGAVASEKPQECAEQEALRVTLCASAPASAVVTDTALYARPAASVRPWSESRVEPGRDAGRVRFKDRPFERADSDEAKSVCAEFSSWDAEQAYSARLDVKYLVARATDRLPNAALVPTSGSAQ